MTFACTQTNCETFFVSLRMIKSSYIVGRAVKLRHSTSLVYYSIG